MTRARLVVALAAGLAGCTRTTELIAPEAMACVAPGPLVHLGGTGPTACAGALAAERARYALCSCNDIMVPGSLIVNSVGASRTGGQPTGAAAGTSPWPGGGPMDGLLPKTFFAAVGTDGDFQTSGHGDVPGSLVVAGTGDAKIGTQGHVLGNAHVAGALRPSTSYWISGDAFVTGDVAGQITVGGTLHTPAGTTVTPNVQVRGGLVREAVAVAPPCNCAAGPAFDIAAAVEGRRAQNANAFLPFSDDVLDELQTAQVLDWPCGEYYLDAIRTGATAALELRVHGHVGIFVAGDVHLGNNLTVTLDADSTLDLVVAGSFVTTGLIFGSPTSPAGTRLWVGSTIVSLQNQVQFGAFVYAPGAVFSAGPGLTFSGSLFVGTLSVAGDVRIGYDPALLQSGAACDASPPAPVL